MELNELEREFDELKQEFDNHVLSVSDFIVSTVSTLETKVSPNLCPEAKYAVSSNISMYIRRGNYLGDSLREAFGGCLKKRKEISDNFESEITQGKTFDAMLCVKADNDFVRHNLAETMRKLCAYKGKVDSSLEPGEEE